jgi:hypothetical protein
MAPNSEPERLPLASRVMWRLLDPSRRLDYAFVAILTALPMFHAWILGVHQARGDYAGYWERPNWALAPLAVPAALWTVRWLAARLAPVSEAWPPKTLPAAVALVQGEEGRRAAYESLQRAILSPRNGAVVLSVTLLLMLADTGGLIAFYLGIDPGPFTERDWSTMFVLPEAELSRGANALLNITAYTAVQAFAILIGISSVVLLLRHNLWFLGRIYQRRRVPDSERSAYIHIDLDDVDHCFGFRKAHAAFNSQVLWLVIGGLLLLIVRFANAGEPGEAADAASNPMALVLAVLPDTGQWVIALSWMAALLIITLPGFVKFLPYVPVGDNTDPRSSIVGYLREFLSDDAWPGDREVASRAVIDSVAARFAANAFWPTGNNRAEQLFLFSGWVFLVMVVPDVRVLVGGQGAGGIVLVGGLVAYAALAWLMTKLAFRMLETGLRFIDPRLVDIPKAGAVQTLTPEGEALPAIRKNVFLSYRRSDTQGSCGRLDDTLSRAFVSPARLFRDVSTLEAGVDFVEAIENALDDSQAVIVLIGPKWLTVADAEGRPRIDDPTDFVHREVAGALARNIRTFPVLVDGARMPSEAELPAPLVPLARRNALEITDSRWAYDVGRLVAALAAG